MLQGTRGRIRDAKTKDSIGSAMADTPQVFSDEARAAINEHAMIVELVKKAVR